jgi:hypothetical protein
MIGLLWHMEKDFARRRLHQCVMLHVTIAKYLFSVAAGRLLKATGETCSKHQTKEFVDMACASL